MRYKDVGVDIDKANFLIGKLKKRIKLKTESFGSTFKIPAGFKEPILVSSTDGVGSKLLVAIRQKKLNTIGIDLVAMNVNDIIALGARPLYFLDYMAVNKLDKKQFNSIISGIIEGCKQAGCDLIGGETAEMPDLYAKNHFDLAGFAVGIVEKKEIIDGREIRFGDVILGFPSQGLHSNGYVLARKILGEKDIRLLKRTKIYVERILSLMKKVKINGMAHITGGGMVEKVAKILPKNLDAKIELNSWKIPKLFREIETEGKIDLDEMFRVFNMGIGFVIILSPNEAKKALKILKKDIFEIGQIEKGRGEVKIS